MSETISEDIKALVDANTVHVDSVDAIPVETVEASLKRDSFACITGLFSPAEIDAARAGLGQGFDAGRDNPSHGEAPGAVMDNFQKVAVGGAMQSWAYRPRFMRVIYNPVWADDIYGMRAIFRRLAQVRNKLQGHAPDYAVDKVEDGLWTAARIQHYPAGGGFLIPHRDTVTPTVTHDAGHTVYHQLLLLITEKGRDFESGGGFVDVRGERIVFEDYLSRGAVVIYDGSTVHGVADIDPHKVPDMTGLSGRLVAFASLYKDMSGEKKLFEDYDRSRADEGLVGGKGVAA